MEESTITELKKYAAYERSVDDMLTFMRLLIRKQSLANLKKGSDFFFLTMRL
jgi:hypothetical protein